jgi:LuxR family transcriptional regulator, maltose regulon positive regulatory protein
MAEMDRGEIQEFGLARATSTLPGHFQLTRTKLVPPRLPSHPVALERHRRWLEPIINHSVCLVQAPSGYGKSTVCTGWHQALLKQGLHVGWVSFSREDDDPARAIVYMFEAVRSAVQGLDMVYDGLTPPQSLATQFINTLHFFGKPFVLFLDDLDRLSDPRILQFLNYVLLHCPDNLHVVCACQANPALPLTYLETHSRLLRVGAEELRLQDSEAQELLNAGGFNLGQEDARKLNTAMAGWVTGLRIGSAALRNNRDALFDIGLASQGAHWLSDYLDENIFQHLTPQTRLFLMRCSVVETMTAELCEALTSELSSAKLLAWLADQNLFLQRLDDAGTRYRIHPVFREFLQARLARDDPQSIAVLHRIASNWFAKHARIAEAIGHALDAGETDFAADLINQAAMSMVEHSDIVALLGWIARLPQSAIAKYFPLRLAEAWALTLTLRPQARTLIDDLRRQADSFENSADTYKLQLELSGIETIFLAVYEDRLDMALEYGYNFLKSATDESSFVTRAVRNATAFCEIQRGNIDVVHDLVRPSELQARLKEQLFTTAYRHCILGMACSARGEVAEAGRIFQSGLEHCERFAGLQSASSGLLAGFAARHLYERGDLDGAAEMLENRLPIIDEAAFHEAVIESYVVVIRIAALRGQMDKAATLVEHAELIGHERGWRRLLAICALERTRLRLPLTTNLDKAFGKIPEPDSKSGLLSLDTRTYAIAVKARWLEAIFTSTVRNVQADITWLKRYAAAAGNDSLSLRVMLMDISSAAITDPEFELNSDQIARLEYAVRKGYGRTLLDGLVPVSDVRMRALLAPVEVLRQLFDHHTRLIVLAPSPATPRVDTVFTILTSREIDVLTGVGRGDSNKEIARQLHLTPETVKWHLKNVMRKLNADSRAQAVANASALGLSLSGEKIAG